MYADRYTNTEADAADFDRADAYGDGPTAAEADLDAYYDGPTSTGEVGIRCGACKGRHDTVADVRWCYDLKAENDALSRYEAHWEAEADRAFARSLEARAENGTWFGPQTEADLWGE